MKKEIKVKLEKTLVPSDQVEVSSRFDDVYKIKKTKKLQSVWQDGLNFYYKDSGGIELKLSVLAENLFRVRYKTKESWEPDFSYAIDPEFKPLDSIDITTKETAKHHKLETAKLICLISKKDLKVTFLNKDNQILLADKKGFNSYATLLEGETEVSVSKQLPKNTNYFGLGDKSGSLRLNGRRFENWNTDAFAFGNETDPLYKSIPFIVGQQKENWFGIFLDNSYRTFFDFGYSHKKQLQFGANGGELNYYFFGGNNSNEIARTYASLTGKPELPAMWMLGFHQCRWSYYPESRLQELADEFRKRKIPCDALYLDIDYMDGYRCFTWNKDYFPDPKAMIKKLEDKGFKTIVMIDPGLKVDQDYPIYKKGLAQDYFCRRSNGDLMVGPVWPENCVFPDFTRAEVRAWWGDLYQELYVTQGVHGFWNDMNEPAVFKINHKTFPDEVIHYHEGYQTNHKKAHNIYGQQMVRATNEGLKTLKPENRPLVITRATYAGGQRFSFAWTGDNIASWEHLKLASIQCQRMSLSGFSFIGSDIGGFIDVPDGELMTRWVQLAVFHPFFRIHSMGNNADGASGPESEAIKEQERINRLDQEPWVFGEKAEKHMRSAIEFRYKLLPYIYTVCKQVCIDGTPAIRSLLLDNPADKRFSEWEEAFYFGDHLVVYPICAPGLKKIQLFLPDGVWYNYHSGEKVTSQKRGLSYNIKANHIPVFARAGACIPEYQVRQFTAEAPPAYLKLNVFYSEESEISQVYEDDGDGFEYEGGNYLFRELRQKINKNSVEIHQSKKGKFNPDYQEIRLNIFGLPFKPTSIEIDGIKIDPKIFGVKKRKVQLSCSEQFKKIVISK